MPDGTFKLASVKKFSFRHVMEHVIIIRIPRTVIFFLHKFATLASLKVPSGSGGRLTVRT